MQLREMTEQELTSWHQNELSEAFPPNERKPLEGILKLLDGKCYDALGLFEDQVLLGYAMMMKRPTATYVLMDYLGVTAARRNGGLGAEILRHVAEQYASRSGVLTEAEAPVPGAAEAHRVLCALRFFPRL